MPRVVRVEVHRADGAPGASYAPAPAELPALEAEPAADRGVKEWHVEMDEAETDPEGEA